MVSDVREAVQLSSWEARILRAVRSQSRQEKAIAKNIRLNEMLVAEFVTELMLKGYVERRRRKWMFFFSREYFSITLEGLAALEAAESSIDRIMEFIKDGGQRLAGEILNTMPPLAWDAAKATYRVAKFILK